jgi:hypothetical protein
MPGDFLLQHGLKHLLVPRLWNRLRSIQHTFLRDRLASGFEKWASACRASKESLIAKNLRRFQLMGAAHSVGCNFNRLLRSILKKALQTWAGVTRHAQRHSSAVRLQSVWRRYRAERACRRKRRLVGRARCQQAALRLQSGMRRYFFGTLLVRRLVQERACELLQCRFRIQLAKANARLRQRTRACVHIQAQLRRRAARRMYQALNARRRASIELYVTLPTQQTNTVFCVLKSR